MPALTIPKLERFAVRSSKDQKKVYEVALGPRGDCSCTCEEFGFERSRATRLTGKCKHVRAALRNRRIVRTVNIPFELIERVIALSSDARGAAEESAFWMAVISR